MEQIIILYFVNGKKIIVPLKQLSVNLTQLHNCYKISACLGQKQKFNTQQNGRSFRYKIEEFVASYYLGKEVQKSKVTNLKLFDFNPGEETQYIQLPNGQFLQGRDTIQVLDLQSFVNDYKLVDIFEKSFYGI